MKKSKRSVKYFLFRIFSCLFLAGILSACSDFIEEDIEDDQVELLGPADQITTETQTLTYWWESLKGASSYRLQIAKPNFSELVSLELDTLLSNTQFAHTLNPGEFEWRVRAENSAYQTVYTSRRITIEEPTDLSEQKVVLVSPAKELKTNAEQLEFKWNAISIANEYQFELHEGDWTGENAFDPKVIAETEITLELEEGKYAWGVLARDNENNKETTYTYRNLYIDRTEPGLPVLQTPANNSNLTGLTQSLTWQYTSQNEITDVNYFIQVFSDQNMNNLVSEDDVDSQQKEITFSATGTYYWRVKAVDEAGNESQYTDLFHFTITNE